MSNRAKHWERLLEAWERSGLTQAEFCRRRNVKAVTFGCWKRKLRGPGNRAHAGSRPTAAGQRSEVKFAEVMWSGQSASGVPASTFSGTSVGGYEIVLSGSLLLRLPTDFDPEKVSQLIHLVAPTC